MIAAHFALFLSSMPPLLHDQNHPHLNLHWKPEFPSMNFISVNCTSTAPFPAKHLSSARTHHASLAHRNGPPEASTWFNYRLPIRTNKKFRVSNAATETRRSLASPSGGEISLGKLSKSSAAMEQLDFERGVCVPFRKYTPETVWNSTTLDWMISLIFRSFWIFMWSSSLILLMMRRDSNSVSELN